MPELRLPQRLSGTPQEQLDQLWSYLFQLVEQLQFSLSSSEAIEEGTTIENLPAVDTVTSTGFVYADEADSTKGYWRYRKYRTGTFDLSGMVKVSPVLEAAVGSAFCSAEIGVALPFAVKTIQYTATAVGDTIVTNAGDTPTAITFRLYRFTDFTDLTETYVRIVASGTYK